MFAVEQWPSLQDPLLVVALRGWVDAGHAGGGAMTALVEQLREARHFGHFDLTDLLDLQQVRPTARLVDGSLRVIDWPRIDLVSGNLGRDVVLVVGPEPSLRWPSVAAEFVDAARRLGVSRAVTLGGMPAMASHRRPIEVLATATSGELAREVGPLRGDYEGPTGMQTVVQHALGRADIGCVGLWAQVPQYVSGAPSPPAVSAMLARLDETFGLEVDRRDFEARADAYLAEVEERLAERPDMAEWVRRIDEAAEGVERDRAEQLVSEIERFLRSPPDDA